MKVAFHLMQLCKPALEDIFENYFMLSYQAKPKDSRQQIQIREMKETKQESSMTAEEEEEEEAQTEVEIWRYVFGFTSAAVVKCAIELGIADTIEEHGGPMTLSDLSSALGCAPSSLYRIMRFLVHHRFFKEKLTSQGTAGYVQSPLSRRLLRRGENSLADYILFESTPAMVAPWHHLSSRVLADGTPAFEGVHGEDVWKYAAANPAYSKLLDDAMASNARLAMSALIEGCPELLHGINKLVDVGGGNGTALRMLVKACPWVHGINFDLPHVVSVAPACEGVEHVGGDMFECVPKADAAFLMQVLHDWNDEECIRILRNCKEAISKEKGKVIIVENVVEQDKNHKLEYVRLMLDMVMMAHTNTGKERTFKEWDYVLGRAGFSRYTIRPIRAVQSVIEAFP